MGTQHALRAELEHDEWRTLLGLIYASFDDGQAGSVELSEEERGGLAKLYARLAEQVGDLLQ